MATRKPPRLRPGDTVGVIAPASPWENRSEILRAVEALEAWDLQVLLGAHIDDRHGYFAGTDEDRAEDLHAMFAHPDVRAIFGFQGGYGSPRLIPLLDRELIAANPKARGKTMCVIALAEAGGTCLDVTTEMFGDHIAERLVLRSEGQGRVGPVAMGIKPHGLTDEFGRLP